MPWEQRHLAADNSQPRATGTHPDGSSATALEDVVHGAAEVEIDLFAGEVLKYQDSIGVTVGILFYFRQNAVAISSGNALGSCECCEHDLLVILISHGENYILVKSKPQYPPDKIIGVRAYLETM